MVENLRILILTKLTN